MESVVVALDTGNMAFLRVLVMYDITIPNKTDATAITIDINAVFLKPFIITGRTNCSLSSSRRIVILI